MKAVVFHGVGDIRLDEVTEPGIEQPTDAVVRLTTSAICGTDLHMVRGTMVGMVPGTILGHEGVGIVEEVGAAIRNLNPGDRVVIPSTIACGYCAYCRAGYYAQCDNANPNGPHAGTAFFGGPKESGPFHGLQAEKARVPFAHAGLIKLPDDVSDEEAILLSDIFPTGYFGADIAEIQDGDTVAVFGCGPVGQFAIISALLLGAGRVFAVDMVPARLAKARETGAEVIDFSKENPIDVIRDLTGGIGVDRAIDAVGVDAVAPESGPAAETVDEARMQREREELSERLPEKPDRLAPSLALEWEVASLAKAGTLAVIGVYPPTMQSFPIGSAMNKNLTIQMGNCNHRRYIPELLNLVRSGAVRPSAVLTQEQPLVSALEAYNSFEHREAGWLKVVLEPERQGRGRTRSHADQQQPGRGEAHP